MATRKSVKVDLDEPEQVEEDDVNDPFAIDFFSQSRVELEDESDETSAETNFHEQDFVVEVKRAWNADLPQVAASEISQALIFSELPNNLAETVCEIYVNTISQIVLQTIEQVGCELVSTVETDFFSEIAQLSREQGICLSFVVEPQQTAAILILDSVFAINIIETALSSETFANERRELSKTELSVLEFLSLNFLKEINKFLAEPLFRWLTIEQTKTDVALSRGLLSQIRIQIGESKGVVKLLLPFEFLQNLSKSENPLLTRRNEKNGKNFVQISQLIQDTYLHAVLGETAVDAVELAALERGDVILIERSSARFADSVITGAVQVRVADAIEPSIYGKLITNEQLQLHVKEINQKNENQLTRFMIPENQAQTLHEDKTDAEETTENGLALEKIVVNVAVELVSRRISLDEIANIRAGQIIELGSRASDPVELVASGRTIAIGELVDVEGNLGVRLTRVLL